ncbi:MAG: YncE family protein, partial [Solirubrobacterales bacterium]|nr:YncE family protein [Solirubrobacterales bacterium]
MRPAPVLVCALVALLLAGCGSSKRPATTSSGTTTVTTKPTPPPARDGSGPLRGDVNLYSADVAGDLSPVVRNDPALVYVPNSMSNTVDVISQRTLKIVEQFPVGALPQHVTPSYDLRTLYVDNDLGNSLTPINPQAGRPGQPIPVEDPSNLYFTPDGRFAIVVAERLQRLDFRDPGTMRLVHSLSVPECRGVDHMDFSADGRYAFASCEFSGRMIELDLRTQQVVRTL